MRRAIICGGAGFVGSAVVKELVACGTEVFVIARPGFSKRMSESRLAGLDITILECDIREISQIRDLIAGHEIDTWYQFAWDGLFHEPLTDYATQIMNIKWAMDAVVTAAEIGCRKFIGAGSISQLELQKEFGQLSQYDKHRVYKTAKQACEYMGRSVAQEHNITFIWPLITNIYGVGEFSNRLINSMIRNLLSGKRQSLSEANQYYDFIYIADAAKAFRLMGEKGQPDRNYVIASGTAQPLRHFLTQVRDIVAPYAELGFGEFPFNGVYLPKEAYSIAALQEDTGFTPEVSFTEGIRRTAEWIAAEGADKG